MRTMLLTMALLVLVGGLGACRQTRGVVNSARKGVCEVFASPCKPDANGQVWAYPVYDGGRGGADAIGTHGYGAFRAR